MNPWARFFFWELPLQFNAFWIGWLACETWGKP